MNKVKNKVAIMGVCSSRLSISDIQDKDNWEFWGVNNLYRYMPYVNWTRWFEIHKISVKNGKCFRKGNGMFRGITVNQYLEDLNSLSIPVYMQKAQDIVANSTEFPINALVYEFGRYFTSSHSWMLAFAIYLGFKTIGIFGVNMDEPSHIDKRPCMEHYIGIAKGKGIEIIIPDNSPLCKDNTLYAYES